MPPRNILPTVMVRVWVRVSFEVGGHFYSEGIVLEPLNPISVLTSFAECGITQTS